MERTQYQYRIAFAIGSIRFTWVRSGDNAFVVHRLADAVVKDQYGPLARVVSVSRILE